MCVCLNRGDDLEIFAPYLSNIALCLQKDHDEKVREACVCVLSAFPPQEGVGMFWECVCGCVCEDQERDSPAVALAAVRALKGLSGEALGVCVSVCVQKRLEGEGREMQLAVLELVEKVGMEEMCMYVPDLMSKVLANEREETAPVVRKKALELLVGLPEHVLSPYHKILHTLMNEDVDRKVRETARWVWDISAAGGEGGGGGGGVRECAAVE